MLSEDQMTDDLVLVLDALDALPETHKYSWYKRLTRDSNKALLDLHLKRSGIRRQ